jgi:RNA polymerase sigma factor (sigma-70 family)
MDEETQTERTTSQLYEDWVRAILQRSPQAWGELLEAYGARLHKDVQISLRKWGLPVELAEDVEQETWLRALRAINKFVWDNEEKFYHWLRAIASRCIYEMGRQSNKVLSIDDLSPDDQEGILDALLEQHALHQDNIENHVILRERMAALEQALRTLKADEREIYVRWLMGEKPRILSLIYQRKAASISQLVRRASEKVEANLLYLQSSRQEDESRD